MKFYQNDFPEQAGMVSGGCLFMSLLDITAKEFNLELTREKVISIYELCNERGFIGKSSDKNLDGAFVWDHKAVLEMSSIAMGYKDAKWEYSARIYTDLLESQG